MEQRHRCVADVARAESEAIGHRHAGDRDLAVAAHDSLGITAGARGVDQHEQVIGRRVLKSNFGVAVCCDLVSPRGGVDVDVVDIAQRASRIRVGQYQLAVGMVDVSMQRRTPAHRVKPHRDNSRHPRGDQDRGEERCVLQQHPDVRRPARVKPRAQCRRDRSALPEMVAPADERILEVDAPIVDINQRGQQIGDGRKCAVRLLAASCTGRGRRGVRQLATDLQQLPGGAAQRELGLLGGQEVAVHRVVGVDADAAMDVNDAVCHPMPGISRPECGGGDLGVGGQILAESPRRLGKCQPQALDVDVAVRQPLPDRLEAADRAVELFTGLCVFSGQLQSSLEHAELERAVAQDIQRLDPVDDLVAADDTSTTDLDAVEPEMPDAAQAGGVQCGHGDARVAGGDQENGSTGIGFGRHQEAVGDRPVRDLSAGSGQPVAVAGMSRPAPVRRPFRRPVRR